MSDLEQCFNCGQPIGRLEQAFLYENHIVCVDCHRRLTGNEAPTIVAADASHRPDSLGHKKRAKRLWIPVVVVLGVVLFTLRGVFDVDWQKWMPSTTSSGAPAPSLASPRGAVSGAQHAALETFETSMSLLWTSKTTWNLTVRYDDPEYQPRSRKDIVNDLRTKESPYSEARISLFSGASFSIIGDTRPIFLPRMSMTRRLRQDITDDVPVSIVSYKGKPCVLLVMGVATVYNTARLGSKERAAQVAGTLVFPALHMIDEAFERTDVGYYSLFVVYGSKDFLKDYSMEELANKPELIAGTLTNLKPEMLGFVAPKESVEKYMSAKITDAELAATGEFFLSDRDVDGFKKVAVAPE